MLHRNELFKKWCKAHSFCVYFEFLWIQPYSEGRQTEIDIFIIQIFQNGYHIVLFSCLPTTRISQLQAISVFFKLHF